jgi:hypothetical protein
MEMKTQIMADVIHVSVAPTPSLLHHNNVGITYLGTSSLRMEPVRSIPLYYVVTPQSMVIVTKAPFIIALAHTVVSRP